MSNVPQPLKNQEGMTLLETMIAMMILSIGLLGLAQLQITSIRGNHSSFTMTTATSVASGGLEALVQSYWQDSSAVTCPAPETLTQDNLNFTRSCEITGVEEGQRTAVVTVTWRGQSGADRTVEVKTLL